MAVKRLCRSTTSKMPRYAPAGCASIWALFMIKSCEYGCVPSRASSSCRQRSRLSLTPEDGRIPMPNGVEFHSFLFSQLFVETAQCLALLVVR